MNERAPAQVRRIQEEVMGHPVRDALARLCYDWLSRQGEGRALFVARDWVEKKAVEHAVERNASVTSVGALLDVIERGAETVREHLVVSAFAALGWGMSFRDLTDAEREIAHERFVRHADWFELSTGYSLYVFADAFLSTDDVRALWLRLSESAARCSSELPKERALQMTHLMVLERSSFARSEGNAARVAELATDPLTKRLANAVLESADATTARLTVRGRFGRAPRHLSLELLRWITGYAALAWLVRAIVWLLGFRMEGTFELTEKELVAMRRVVWLGRTLRESRVRYDTKKVGGARRLVRYPFLHMLIGICALTSGILVGGLYGFDGIRMGSPSLLVLGACLVLFGASLDVILNTLIPGVRGRVTLDIYAPGLRGLRLTRVPLDDADRFVDALVARAT